tara:strand:- start:10156 stop:10500 length:345 start_codon:yes stop_codon:yes gene_type:complete
MPRNEKLLDAAILTLRAQALGSLGAIEVLLDSAAGIGEHTQFVDEIIKHARILHEAEESSNALSKYLKPPPPAAAPPPQPRDPSPPITEEELMKRSATFRKSPGGKAKAKKDKK